MINNMLIVVDPRNNDEWRDYENLVNEDGFSFYYARRDYLEMVRDIVEGRIILILARDKKNKVLAALPCMDRDGLYGRVMNSLPFFGSNPGIVSVYHGRREEEKHLKEKLLDIFWNITEDYFSTTIIENPFDVFPSQYGNGVNFIDNRIGLITRLPERGEDILPTFHQKTRNMVNKALKGGLIFHGPMSMSWGLDEIVNMHRINMAEIGAPVKPDAFFYWVHNKIKTGSNEAQVYVATYKDQVVAGLVLLVHNLTAEYFMPAVNREFRPMAPLNGLIYIAMGNLCTQGVRFWNWGGTSLPSQQGVYLFKKRFGAEETMYTYHVRASSEVMNSDITSAELRREYPYFYVVPYHKRFIEEQTSYIKMYEGEDK